MRAAVTPTCLARSPLAMRASPGQQLTDYYNRGRQSAGSMDGRRRQGFSDRRPSPRGSDAGSVRQGMHPTPISSRHWSSALGTHRRMRRTARSLAVPPDVLPSRSFNISSPRAGQSTPIEPPSTPIKCRRTMRSLGSSPAGSVELFDRRPC